MTAVPSSDSSGVSIIIACRNEEGSVEKCVREVLRVLPDAEIVVVDGGTDRTFEIVEALAVQHSNIKPVKNIDDRGKGHAIKTGIAASSGSFMAQFDCDLQFYADDLPALIEPLTKGVCDVCVGSRFMEGADRTAYESIFFRDVGNSVMGWYISALTGKRITDVTTGMKAWTRGAIDRIAFRDDKYSYEAEIIVRAARNRLRVHEVPVKYASRESGASMHASTLALLKAGLTIMAKSFAARFL